MVGWLYAGARSKCTPELPKTGPTNYATERHWFGHGYAPDFGLEISSQNSLEVEMQGLKFSLIRAHIISRLPQWLSRFCRVCLGDDKISFAREGVDVFARCAVGELSAF